MRFLLLSNDGDGLGIALRLKEEGHEVSAHIRNRKASRDYDNLIAKHSDYTAALRSVGPSTIVVFDSTGGGKTAERLRSQGTPVIGASMLADQLELDRAFALGLMEEAGIQVPPSQHFTDWEEGVKYVTSRGERMCFKSDNNKLTSYVASCPEDMVEFLHHQQSEGETADFELQDFVKGLEISTEGWFDGYQFARPFNHTFEKKQLMNDDIGPSSGCAGNVVWACQHDYCPIVEDGLARFEPLLRHHGYRGMIDLNAIVNEQGVWGLEWTPRTGYDAFPALMEMLTEGVGDMLARYAKGERVSQFPMQAKGFGAGIRVSGPPYPAEDIEAPKGIPIRNLVRADRPHCYFYNVFLDEEGVLRSSGAFGAICVATGFGETIFGAMGKCLEIAHRMDFRSKQFRTDLAQKFDESYQKYSELVDHFLKNRNDNTPSEANLIESI